MAEVADGTELRRTPAAAAAAAAAPLAAVVLAAMLAEVVAAVVQATMLATMLKTAAVAVVVGKETVQRSLGQKKNNIPSASRRSKKNCSGSKKAFKHGSGTAHAGKPWADGCA
jgi:hypothetical protein